MGQRAQIIVQIPKYYLNPNNPNNREMIYIIYHNQWLYGYSFLNHLKDIMKTFNLIVKDYKEGALKNFTPDYKELIDKAIKYSNYKNPLQFQNTHFYYSDDDYNKGDNEYIGRLKDWKTLFNHLDNNNGFIFLKINENGFIEYDIVSGLEDTPTNERKTPKQYLNLFYKDISKEYQENKKEFDEVLKELEDFKRFDYNTLEIPEPKEKEFNFIVHKEYKVYSLNEDDAIKKVEKQLKEEYVYLIKLKEDEPINKYNN